MRTQKVLTKRGVSVGAQRFLRRGYAEAVHPLISSVANTQLTEGNISQEGDH